MFEWDEAKRQRNFDRHGVDFELIHDMDFDTSRMKPDDRFEYGEARDLVMGLIDGRLYIAVVTERGDKVRLISLRKANARERKQYDTYTSR